MPTYNNRQCYFHDQGIENIDYKDVRLLKKFITQYKKITPRYYTGTCLKHQKKLTTAIKRARMMGLLPFIRS